MGSEGHLKPKVSSRSDQIRGRTNVRGEEEEEEALRLERA